jgi:hypothetical protein
VGILRLPAERHQSWNIIDAYHVYAGAAHHRHDTRRFSVAFREWFSVWPTGSNHRQAMIPKPRPLPRIDLTHLSQSDALAKALASFDNTTSILFCARRIDQAERFGSVIKRDDLPFYLRFALYAEESGKDLRDHLSIMLLGVVADQDANLVTGLMVGVAQQAWRTRNLTGDQIRGASTIVSASEAVVDLIAWPRH